MYQAIAQSEFRWARFLHRTDRTQIGRLPVTNVARTLIDLGGVLSTRKLQNALDDALTRRLTTPSLVIAAISRNRHRRRAGSDRLELALLPWLGTSLESPAEAEVLRILSVQGLPAPVTQVTEIVGGGARFRLDFAWIDQRVALEIDGFQFHDGPDRFVSDRYRANLLTDAGWHVLRTTLSELTQDPNPLCRALRRLLLGNSVAFGDRPDDNLGGITGAQHGKSRPGGSDRADSAPPAHTPAPPRPPAHTVRPLAGPHAGAAPAAGG